MIAWSAVGRLLNPVPLENVGIGLVVSVMASAIELWGGARPLVAGRRYHSILLEADARHLMTDVWTSAGVVVGVALVALTGWLALDPLIALVVAANIVWSGVHLVRRRSALGLLDTAIPTAERERIEDVLATYEDHGIAFHSLRTREAGPRRFISFHVLVPGDWSVQHGHDVLEQIEHDVRAAFDTPNHGVYAP